MHVNGAGGCPPELYKGNGGTNKDLLDRYLDELLKLPCRNEKLLAAAAAAYCDTPGCAVCDAISARFVETQHHSMRERAEMTQSQARGLTSMSSPQPRKFVEIPPGTSSLGDQRLIDPRSLLSTGNSEATLFPQKASPSASLDVEPRREASFSNARMAAWRDTQSLGEILQKETGSGTSQSGQSSLSSAAFPRLQPSLDLRAPEETTSTVSLLRSGPCEYEGRYSQSLQQVAEHVASPSTNIASLSSRGAVAYADSRLSSDTRCAQAMIQDAGQYEGQDGMQFDPRSVGEDAVRQELRELQEKLRLRDEELGQKDDELRRQRERLAKVEQTIGFDRIPRLGTGARELVVDGTRGASDVGRRQGRVRSSSPLMAEGAQSHWDQGAGAVRRGRAATAATAASAPVPYSHSLPKMRRAATISSNAVNNAPGEPGRASGAASAVPFLTVDLYEVERSLDAGADAGLASAVDVAETMDEEAAAGDSSDEVDLLSSP